MCNVELDKAVTTAAPHDMQEHAQVLTEDESVAPVSYNITHITGDCKHFSCMVPGTPPAIDWQ